jgi:hypothetical protein
MINWRLGLLLKRVDESMETLDSRSRAPDFIWPAIVEDEFIKAVSSRLGSFVHFASVALPRSLRTGQHWQPSMARVPENKYAKMSTVRCTPFCKSSNSECLQFREAAEDSGSGQLNWNCRELVEVCSDKTYGSDPRRISSDRRSSPHATSSNLSHS